MINYNNIRKINKLIRELESTDKVVQYYDNKIIQKDNIPFSDNMWKICFMIDRDRKVRRALQLYITQK